MPNSWTSHDLLEAYRAYIACLNDQDWPSLGRFVDDAVEYNGERVGLPGYRGMLERNFDEIPDLRFDIELLIADPPHVASRLRFDCAPKGLFLGVHVNGRRVIFCENVFYEFAKGKICRVQSIIDKVAIEMQVDARH